MYAGRSVSLVIPAYNEEATIAEVVSEYRSQPEIDEIVVVDNNCRDRTAERARAAGARVVNESRPGYGSALLAGMSAARGEILVLTEADGSFRARDVPKLLAYIDDAGLVVGTRTTRQLIEQGANMRFVLRWGNVAMAKFVELLWFFSHEPRFTDVGCTYRAVTREAFLRMQPQLRETGPAFSPEMMCQALISGCRAIEVPVTYSRRLGGESKHSDTLGRQVRTAWKMFKAICRKRLFGKGLEKASEPASQPSSAR